jgi:hypothetical protein
VRIPPISTPLTTAASGVPNAAITVYVGIRVGFVVLSILTFVISFTKRKKHAKKYLQLEFTSPGPMDIVVHFRWNVAGTGRFLAIANLISFPLTEP